MTKDDKEPTSVLDYLTKVWEEATVPQGNYIPAGSVVIHRAGNSHDYRVWEMLGDLTENSLVNLRIVSEPRPKVGFYMQDKGHAYYWDGSVWRLGKGGSRSSWQAYEFSTYIGDAGGDAE